MEFREAEAPEGLQIEVDHPDRTVEVESIRRLIEYVVGDRGAEIRYLGVVLTDRETVHALNRDHLEHDFPTDVISFPLNDAASASDVVDGEIYVDLDMAAERAPEFGSDFETEARRYVVHGLLHLLGLDDATAEARENMRRLEDRYLDESSRPG